MFDIIKFDKKIIDCTTDYKKDINYFENVTKEIIEFTQN